jgi:adenylosuccinate synthase
MLIMPTTLVVEGEALRQKGCADWLQRLTMDPAAHLVTPWHSMLCRVKELCRGGDRFGSVGLGVGEAVKDRASNPESLQLSDCFDGTVLDRKLLSLRHEKISACEALIRESGVPEARDLVDQMLRQHSFSRLQQFYRRFAEKVQDRLVADEDVLLNEPTPVVLEGAQGVLLDPVVGFPPYVTKSDSTFAGAFEFVRRAGVKDVPVECYGALRCYATRHGMGPLPTETPEVAVHVREPHNADNPWQGKFRFGSFDLVLARYAVKVSGGVNALAISCLDQVAALPKFQVVKSYWYTGSLATLELDELCTWTWDGGRIKVLDLKTGTGDPSSRTELLERCRPADTLEMATWNCKGPLASINDVPLSCREFVDLLSSEAGLGIPVRLLSAGPTEADKVWLN